MKTIHISPETEKQVGSLILNTLLQAGVMRDGAKAIVTITLTQPAIIGKKLEGEALLATRLDELAEFEPYVTGKLKEFGVTRLYQLIQLTEDYLYNQKTIGYRTLESIMRSIREFNRHLNTKFNAKEISRIEELIAEENRAEKS